MSTSRQAAPAKVPPPIAAAESHLADVTRVHDGLGRIITNIEDGKLRSSSEQLKKLRQGRGAAAALMSKLEDHLSDLRAHYRQVAP